MADAKGRVTLKIDEDIVNAMILRKKVGQTYSDVLRPLFLSNSSSSSRSLE